MVVADSQDERGSESRHSKDDNNQGRAEALLIGREDFR
jgi:hypothetical protein